MSPLLLALLACGELKVPPADSAATYDDPCEVPMAGDATSQGEIDCVDGVCTVPAGRGWRGAADPAHPDSCPAQQLRLSAFAIDEAEVSRAQWAACEADGACTPAREHCQIDTEGQPAADLPMTCIDWQQAQDYCAWHGGQLPTEAQWEIAVRGRQGPPWPWGRLAPDCTQANFRFATSYCELGPIVGGHYAPGPFGLLDGTGNVWEWTADWYDASWYRQSPTEDPAGPTTDCHKTVDGPAAPCSARVIRGGAFDTTEGTTTTSRRSYTAPDVADRNIGLRCAYSPGG